MRKQLSPSDVAKIKRMIEEEEARIEVSEVEKILSHLAYLMDLVIEGDDSVREMLKEQIGVAPKLYSQLPRPEVECLEELAKGLDLHKKSRLVFWMWRAWLQQMDLQDSRAASTVSRTSMEWHSLDDELARSRQKLQDYIGAVAREVEYLAAGVEQAQFPLSTLGGSPLAVVRTSRRLLEAACERITDLERALRAAYGFGAPHRPHKRFDQKTPLNIRAFYFWKVRKMDSKIVQEFTLSKDDQGLSEAQARTAVSKAATRMQGTLFDYDEALRLYEQNGQMPSEFFVRRLPREVTDTSARTLQA